MSFAFDYSLAEDQDPIFTLSVLMQVDSPPHEEEENGPHPEVIREMPFVMLGNVTSFALTKG